MRKITMKTLAAITLLITLTGCGHNAQKLGVLSYFGGDYEWRANTVAVVCTPEITLNKDGETYHIVYKDGALLDNPTPATVWVPRAHDPVLQGCN